MFLMGNISFKCFHNKTIGFAISQEIEISNFIYKLEIYLPSAVQSLKVNVQGNTNIILANKDDFFSC